MMCNLESNIQEVSDHKVLVTCFQLLYTVKNTRQHNVKKINILHLQAIIPLG
jgi:hypothetical protein